MSAPPDSQPSSRWDRLRYPSVRMRWGITTALAVLTAVVLATVLLSVWADRVLLNEDRFSARIASTLRQDEMNRYLADELTEQVLARAPELMGVRPAIEAVLSEALRTRTAIVGARAALREAHRGVTLGVAEESITIDLQAVFTLAAALMQRGAPDIAERFEAGLDTTRLDAAAVGLRTGLFERMQTLADIRWPLTAAGLVLLGCVVIAAPSRRTGFLFAAGAIAGTGLIGLIGQRAAEVWLVQLLPEDEDARVAVTLAWRTVLREYQGWNVALLALGIAGAVGALANARLPDRTAAREFITRSAWGRTTAGMALAIAGLALARWPLDAVRVIVVAGGVVVAGGGVFLLLRSALAGLQGVRPHEYADRVRDARVLLTAYAVIAMFVIGASVSVWFATTLEVEPSPVEPAPITVCNGHQLLCDRPLDQVTFPGTHNSMSAASVRGWYFPSQRDGIAQQLRDGVRALLIDTYYGIASPQGVRTVIESEVRREQLVAEHGEEVVAAAERIAERLAPGGEEALFLCHSFCELGATPLSSALLDIRDYLDANPSEFLVILVQDQTTAEDTIAEFELADLADRAYAHPLGEDWPTLGALLADGKQLLVLVEHEGASPEDTDWYQPAFAGLVRETTFDARTPAQLTCTPGRGEPGSPLFLMNHWINERPPYPARALAVNTRDLIVGRARDCAEDWGGQVPNIVAVDFYDTGDLFAAVAELNGLPEDEEDLPFLGGS